MQGIRYGSEGEMESVQDSPAPGGTGWNFRVPVGRSRTGALVAAVRASATAAYTCPGCGSPLILRRGEIRSPHFAHNSSHPCSPETALHLGAKALVARIFRRRLNSPRAVLPNLEVPCSGSSLGRAGRRPTVCPGRAWFPLAGLEFDEVAEERITSEGLRPDVLLLHRGEPVLGIEVLVTHAVGARKAARTTYPWVELDAVRVIAAPRRWRPCGRGHPWTGHCMACQWVEQVARFASSEHDDPVEFAAELAAAGLGERLGAWLDRRSGRGQLRVVWRCPSCRRTNKRVVRREALVAAARATSLGPPILHEVRAWTREGPDIAIQYENTPEIARNSRMTPIPAAPHPVLRIHPDCRRPLRIQLWWTNRPWAFLCPRCGGDCMGTLPPAWEPVPAWETLSAMGNP